MRFFGVSKTHLQREGIIVPLDWCLLVYPKSAGVDKGAGVDEGAGVDKGEGGVCPGGGAGVEEGEGEGLGCPGVVCTC